jgi:hypothetical protein
VEKKHVSPDTGQAGHYAWTLKTEPRTETVVYETSPVRISNKKSKNRLIHTVILIAAFALLIVSALIQFPWGAGPGSVGLTKSIPQIIAEPFTRMNIIPKSRSYSETRQIVDMKDGEIKKTPDFVLNGIMELSDGPRAVINNLIVGLGDTVEGATVSSISKKNVVLKQNESEINLDLR